MHHLQDIPVKVLEDPADQSGTGNVLPLLHEIRHALARLAATGEPTTIDLAAIPFAPGDHEQLLRMLGEGEVSVSLRILGETRIRESIYPGVWIVRHDSPQGTQLTTQIEITRTPSLLVTPKEDVDDAVDALDTFLHEHSAEASV